MTHTCDDRCSHRATPDSLTALGFPVRKTDKCVAAIIVVREGTTFERARFLATEAGLLRTCTRRPELR